MWYIRRPGFFAIAVIVVIAVGVYNYVGIVDMSDLSIQIWLRLYASSIYEYHTKTGRWPTRTEDLAETSLPQQTPHWREVLDIEADVIVWPKDLNPDPKDNAGVILVYQNKGLYAELGHNWVCWGDLRTEYITTEELHAHLQAGKK
jgi:hypothetical protein